MATKQEIVELIQKYGKARPSINKGDKVLYDGAEAGGEYIVLCTVIEATEDKIKVQGDMQYHLNGGEYPERKISTISKTYYEKSIPEHILGGREIFKMIAEAFDSEEKTKDIIS